MTPLFVKEPIVIELFVKTPEAPLGVVEILPLLMNEEMLPVT
jgi:hypothetical protein